MAERREIIFRYEEVSTAREFTARLIEDGIPFTFQGKQADAYCISVQFVGEYPFPVALAPAHADRDTHPEAVWDGGEL